MWPWKVSIRNVTKCPYSKTWLENNSLLIRHNINQATRHISRLNQQSCSKTRFCSFVVNVFLAHNLNPQSFISKTHRNNNNIHKFTEPVFCSLPKSYKHQFSKLIVNKIGYKRQCSSNDEIPRIDTCHKSHRFWGEKAAAEKRSKLDCKTSFRSLPAARLKPIDRRSSIRIWKHHKIKRWHQINGSTEILKKKRKKKKNERYVITGIIVASAAISSMDEPVKLLTNLENSNSAMKKSYTSRENLATKKKKKKRDLERTVTLPWDVCLDWKSLEENPWSNENGAQVRTRQEGGGKC